MFFNVLQYLKWNNTVSKEAKNNNSGNVRKSDQKGERKIKRYLENIITEFNIVLNIHQRN